MEFLSFNEAYQKDLFQALNKTEFTEDSLAKGDFKQYNGWNCFFNLQKTQKFSFLFFSFLKYKFSVNMGTVLLLYFYLTIL